MDDDLGEFEVAFSESRGKDADGVNGIGRARFKLIGPSGHEPAEFATGDVLKSEPRGLGVGLDVGFVEIDDVRVVVQFVLNEFDVFEFMGKNAIPRNGVEAKLESGKR